MPKPLRFVVDRSACWPNCYSIHDRYGEAYDVEGSVFSGTQTIYGVSHKLAQVISVFDLCRDHFEIYTSENDYQLVSESECCMKHFILRSNTRTYHLEPYFMNRFDYKVLREGKLIGKIYGEPCSSSQTVDVSSDEDSIAILCASVAIDAVKKRSLKTVIGNITG